MFILCGEDCRCARDNVGLLGEGQAMTEAEKAITEFAERLKTYYKHLQGKTDSGMVVYHIEEVKKEFLGGNYGGRKVDQDNNGHI